jgi:G:T/U-mismatch repair DNA glycosylase
MTERIALAVNVLPDVLAPNLDIVFCGTAAGAVSAANPHRLRRLIAEFHPQIIAFTSKRAAAEFMGHAVDYGLLAETAESTRLFVLPSPSGAARRYWSQDHWQELSRLRSAGR